MKLGYEVILLLVEMGTHSNDLVWCSITAVVRADQVVESFSVTKLL